MIRKSVCNTSGTQNCVASCFFFSQSKFLQVTLPKLHIAPHICKTAISLVQRGRIPIIYPSLVIAHAFHCNKLPVKVIDVHSSMRRLLNYVWMKASSEVSHERRHTERSLLWRREHRPFHAQSRQQVSSWCVNIMWLSDNIWRRALGNNTVVGVLG